MNKDNSSLNHIARLERIRERAHKISAITCSGCSDWTHPLCWIASELDAVLADTVKSTPLTLDPLATLHVTSSGQITRTTRDIIEAERLPNKI